ncbi:MAG TPA: hemolysin family protein [Ruania sp.]|nr:hemolysin family protein [Ruania sp.]
MTPAVVPDLIPTPPTVGTVLLVLSLVGVVIAGVLTAAEEAIGWLTRSAAADYAAQHARGARVQQIAEYPVRARRAANFSRSAAELTSAICLTSALNAWVHRWWLVLVISLAVLIALITFVVELLPRRIARRRPAQTVALVGPLVLTVQYVMEPLATFVRRLGRRRGTTTVEELQDETENLRDMVDRVSERDQIDDDEREMLQSVFELGTTRVREVMVPRTDMVTITAGEPVVKAMRLFVRSGFSRIPVVGESVDELAGILYLKDALAYMVGESSQGTTTVDQFMRPALFVPETKVVDDLLDEMRAGNVHIAAVVDEYGGVAGLVTIEDILEELVGELTDEHDPREDDVREMSDGSYIVPARLGLDELGELFGVEIADDEVTTAAGLLTKALGRVPIRGSQVHTHGLCLQAWDFQGRRKRLHTLRARAAGAEPEHGDRHEMAATDEEVEQ